MSFKLENNMYIARSNYDLKLLVNKEGIHLKDIDISFVTDLSNVFAGFDFSKWYVIQVENFSNMCCGCEKFNADLSAWKVNQGKNFDFMFYDCKSFNQDLNDWKISLVKAHAEKMFWLADQFCHDLKNWNLSEAEKNKLGLHNLI